MTYHIRNKNNKTIVQLSANITGFKTVTDLMRFMMDNYEIFEDYDGVDYEVVTKEIVEKVI